MKMKKAITIILLTMMMMLQFSFTGVKAVDTETMKVILKVSEEVKIEPGKNVEVIVKLESIPQLQRGIRYMQAQLEFDKDVLSYVRIEPANANSTWKVDSGDYNKEKNKFIAENDVDNTKLPVTTTGDILKIIFSINSNAQKGSTTTVKMKDIKASDGDKLVISEDTSASITIPQEQKPEEKMTVTEYEMNQESKIIYRVPQNTTIKEFLTHVQTNATKITMIDASGKTVEEGKYETELVTTGMKIKAGNTLEYTISVIGDVDSDGKITINDLAKVKLHEIELEGERLTGAFLEAANVDLDEIKGGIGDIACIKCILIDLKPSKVK